MTVTDVPRVVHVVVSGEMGGAERMVLDLARSRETGAHQAIALLSSSPTVQEIYAESGALLHHRRANADNAAAYLWRSLGPTDAAWIATVLAKERASIAHLHTFGSQVVGTRAALRAGVAILRTEHSSRVYVTPSCWPFSRWSLRRSDAVVAVSDYIRKLAVARAPFLASGVRVVGNGVDTTRFVPATEGKSLGNEQPFRFVMLARLEPRKGVDLALDVLARLPEARLEIVGEGCERARLERRAASLGLDGRAHFHGFLPDPLPVLQRADAALTSSTDEGLGLGLLECMSAGLPVVAVPVGGIPEIVLDGETGWLSASRSAAALAAAMSAAMTSRERAGEIGRRARRFVERRHSLGAMAAGYRDIYQTLHPSGDRARQQRRVA